MECKIFAVYSGFFCSQKIMSERVFESFEEFQTAIIIDNKNILQLEKPLEILRAGIIDNEPMLKTPWGDKRLANKAVNK